MKKSILIIALLILSGGALGEYYADIEIFVMDSGVCEIKGLTNHPAIQPGQHEEFTFKDGPTWTLRLDLNGLFSNFVYEIHLPEMAQLSKVENTGFIILEGVGNRITIKGTGQNEELRLLVVYHIERKNNGSVFYVLIALTLLVLSICILYLYYRKQRTSRKPEENYENLKDRQREIMLILRKNGGEITQKELMQKMKIPKSSISRNVEALVKKGYLKKERRGMTNFLKIIKNEKDLKEQS
ncbi:MAG: MarR family transcriptional regulator [Candidatus Diapherotrites archaeon]